MSKYIFKSAGNCIVKLRIDTKDKNTKTNLSRTGILKKNKLFAKYRTNRAYVVSIIDKDSKEKLDKIRSDQDKDFEYVAGEYKEEANYDTNIDEICTRGIHFYLSEKVAFFHNKTIENGNCKDWYENGQIASEDNYVNGEKHGVQTSWYENGQIKSVYNYVNGEKHENCKEWHEHGKIRRDQNYINGKRNGTSKEWYENEQIEVDYNYVNDKLHGICKEWYKNGQIRIDSNYKNGEKHGKNKAWFDDGKIKYDVTYVNGEIKNNNKK